MTMQANKLSAMYPVDLGQNGDTSTSEALGELFSEVMVMSPAKLKQGLAGIRDRLLTLSNKYDTDIEINDLFDDECEANTTWDRLAIIHDAAGAIKLDETSRFYDQTMKAFHMHMDAYKATRKAPSIHLVAGE